MNFNSHMHPCNHDPNQITEHFHPLGSVPNQYPLPARDNHFSNFYRHRLVLLVLLLHIMGIHTVCIFFSGGLFLLLSIMLLRFIHVIPYISKLFSFFYYCIVFHHINIPKLFIHFSIDGHLQFLTIMNVSCEDSLFYFFN